MPGSPGGLGVREAMFIFLLSQQYSLSEVALLPIIFRVLNILGDVLFFSLNKFKNGH